MFNAAYTLPRTDQAAPLDGYAEGAWFWSLEDFTRDVFMPLDHVLMLAIIAFEMPPVCSS